jgi:hypothetical protein
MLHSTIVGVAWGGVGGAHYVADARHLAAKIAPGSACPCAGRPRDQLDSLRSLRIDRG